MVKQECAPYSRKRFLLGEMPKILVFDIETTLLRAYIWDCGEQVIKHGQLVEGYDQFNIICICYSWLHEKKIYTLSYDLVTQDPSAMIKEFDKVVAQADIIVGKNSRKFDIKMINTVRMARGLKPFPNWAVNNSDLESQFRKHFRLPSQSLDYVAKMLRVGLKGKMELYDWIAIQNYNIDPVEGLKAFKKMLKYCRNDVMITKEGLIKSFPYIISDINFAEYCSKVKEVKQGKKKVKVVTPACKACGTRNVIKNGTRVRGRIPNQKVYQRLQCEFGHYAGEIEENEFGQFVGNIK